MEDKVETSERMLQVTSDSSIDGYIRALQAGCRCVEVRRLWEEGGGSLPCSALTRHPMVGLVVHAL